MYKLDLVIFDMDGLLLDTETISLAAWKKSFQKYNVNIDVEKLFFNKILGFLYKNARFKKKYFKKDIYYAKNDDILNDDIKLKNCIRLRVEHGGYTFCSKDRKIVDGVEVNDEIEVKVSKKKARFIINFLSSLQGYREYVRKEKKGYAFIYKNSLVEVSNIKGLGDFVEIEFLNSSDSVESQVHKLKAILKEIGIDEKDIETKAYIDMLKELNN